MSSCHHGKVTAGCKCEPRHMRLGKIQFGTADWECAECGRSWQATS